MRASALISFDFLENLMETINEYPKILFGAEGAERIVADAAGEDAARAEGFVAVDELATGEDAKPAAAAKKGK